MAQQIKSLLEMLVTHGRVLTRALTNSLSIQFPATYPGRQKMMVPVLCDPGGRPRCNSCILT